MPKPEPEFTEAEAIEHVKAHEKKHGREMKVPPGQEKKNDTPTQAELDAVLPATDSEGDDE